MKAQEMRQLTVTKEMHKTLYDFFSRLEPGVVKTVLSRTHDSVTFSEDEIDIKATILFGFYCEYLRPAAEKDGWQS